MKNLIVSSLVLLPMHCFCQDGEKPNFLIIMSDQHAPQFSGVYGHPMVKTPTLNKLAEKGVLFQNAYTTSPICVPARMSFMTGKYVHNIGIWDNGVPLAEDQPTWAHYLRTKGYNVALSGKIHFRGFDQLHGFEAQLGVDMNGMMYPMPPNWKNYSLPERKESRKTIGSGPGTNSVIESDDFCAEKALVYLHAPSRKDNPWALFVGLVSPHPPYKVPQKYYDMYPEEVVDMPDIPYGHIAAMHPSNRRLRYGLGFVNEDILPEEQIRKARSTYYGMVTYMDDLIGQMVKALEETGQLENTVIIYVSDHGEMLGEHGLWNKLNFYEQSARIPLIISYPKALLQHHQVSQPVSMVDLTATILSMAGIREKEIVSPIDGNSLLPLLTQINAPWQGKAFSECYADYSTGPKAMLRRGDYKFICYFEEEPELFNLKNDPGEFNNLAKDPLYSQVVSTMQKELLSFWHPDKLKKTVIESQQRRLMLRPYLFPYIEEERGKWPEKFTKELNQKTQ